MQRAEDRRTVVVKEHTSWCADVCKCVRGSVCGREGGGEGRLELRLTRMARDPREA